MVKARSYFGVFTGLVAMALMLTLPSVANAAPANDNFADAETISGGSASIYGTNIGATTEIGEPSPAGSSRSVWYRWTAPVSGRVAMDTCTYYNFDTVLSVHTGSTLGSLMQEAANDDADDDGCSLGSTLNFNATAGTTYYVRVAGYASSQGKFTLNLQQVPAPPNDNFADAETISGESASGNGTTAGATREPGEPDHYTTNPRRRELVGGRPLCVVPLDGPRDRRGHVRHLRFWREARQRAGGLHRRLVG
jgi:hypothetical protein